MSEVNYLEIIDHHPWVVKERQDCILSPDSDGFLCGLLFAHFLNWKVVGYYDGKIMVLKEGLKAGECVFLDMDVYRRNIKSVGQHMVLYNKRNIPLNWKNFSNCVQLNNLRNFDAKQDFQRKYPFATVHFLLGLLHAKGIIATLSELAIWPLLFTDGVCNNLFGYPENCLDWLTYLGMSEPTNILYPVFYGHHNMTSIMQGISDFFSIRDRYNAQGQFINGSYVPRGYKRSGHELRISNTRGEPINLVSHGSVFHIHETEKVRVEGFIKELGKYAGWAYKQEDWPWVDLKLCRFSKRSLERLNTATYNELLRKRVPLSFVIRSGAICEFTLEEPDTIT